jgi:hypothetical protein
MTKSELPQEDRLIKCQGHDWSPFTCVGKMIAYKPGSGRSTGKLHFMRRDRDGRFEPDTNTWKDVETWEYLEELEAGE